MRIADIHAHIFPDAIAEKASDAIGVFYDKGSNHTANLSVLQEQEALAGIEAFVVSSSATSPAQVDHINSFISSCVKDIPGVIPFGTLFPTMENWQPVLEQLPELGIKGIKIHPDFQKIHIDDPSAVEMYKAIAKSGFPVLFHTGDPRYDYSAPERLTNLIRQVPDLIAIAAHFGGWGTWERIQPDSLPENVYYDTSSSLMYMQKEQALDLIDRIGPNRFLFGTDFPMWTPKEEVARFLDLGLDDATNELILYKNFEQLFL